MWEVQQHVIDEAVPAAIGAATAGAFYYLSNKFNRRHDNVVTDRETASAVFSEESEIAKDLRIAALSMKAMTDELKLQRAAATASGIFPMKFGPETTLAKLKAYRKRDPLFRQAIAKFVEAEATQTDPVEGLPFEEETGGQGPVQSKIREMLRA
jgi:hypothetical protein